MAAFQMRTSIIRRTIFLASMLPLIMIADFASTYWTNRRMVEGLQEINETNEGLDAINHTGASLNAAMEALRSFAEKPDPAKRTAFVENLKAAESSASRVGHLEGGGKIIARLIGIRRSAWGEVRPPVKSQGLEARLLVANQFSLETEEELRKLQLLLKERADISFDRVYGDRWFPLVVTSVLDISFFILLFALLVPLLRGLAASMQNLTDATDRITAGNSDYQAPILSADELGKVTDAFNRVVASLNLKESEGKARIEAEIRRLEFISRTAEDLAQTLDLDVILRKVVNAAVPYLADWSVIDLFGADGEVRREAIGTSFAGTAGLIERMQLEAPKRIADSKVLADVHSEQKSVLFPDFGAGVPAAKEWLGKEGASQIEIVSALCVPISVRRDVVGVLSLISSRADEVYGRREQLLAEDLARRAGYAIENSRLFQEAKLAVQTRDDFLSIASHELRTPLTPLRMQLQMLGRALEGGTSVDPARVENFISTSDRMVTRLTRLVEDLLEVSRINSGRLELQYEEFNLSALIKEILSRFQWEIEKVGAPVNLMGPDRLMVSADPGKIEQVFVNLLTNALKYGARRPIRVELSDEDDRVRLVVRDEGIGIAIEDQARIFQRFERAVNTSTYSGLGLGLYITSQIVELHGGKISLESGVEKGSAFSILLPKRNPVSSTSAV